MAEATRMFMDRPERDGEPAMWLVLKESQARKIVAAAENGRAHQVVDLLKLQPWWPEVCAGVRMLRHLKPLGYIELSERPVEMARS
jgi:hypothetical protein